MSVLFSRFELFPLRIPLKAPFITSLGALTEVESVVLRATTTDGLIGWGECNPFWSINGETQETCLAVGRHLAKALIGCRAGVPPAHPLGIPRGGQAGSLSDSLSDSLEDAHRIMDRLIYGNNSIKSAFDIALHDIAAQAAGMPLYKLLGGEERRTLITDYTVSLGVPEKMAEDALAIVRNGFTVIKVKLGGTPEEDVARVLAIRAAIGEAIPLRIDANQGWTPEQAILVLNALCDANIQHCEEPIPRWQFMEMKRVKDASPIPIMADESCCDHHDAKRLIALGACQRFNIKLGKSGGLFKAKKILDLAERAGMEVQIGGFLESRLAWTAAAHLALTSPAVRYCDMDTPLMFTADPVVGGITYSTGGTITLPVGNGLGASIDPAFLKGGIEVT